MKFHPLKDSLPYHRLQTKFEQGNVFTPVCYFVHGGGGVYPSMQWDRGGVCIPECNGQEGCVSQNAMGGGVTRGLFDWGVV